jgi:hypothetical protein
LAVPGGNGILRLELLAALVALAMSVSSCGQSQMTVAEQATERTFASPEAAGAALLRAVKSGDRNALITIFGPDSQHVLFTGDAAMDQGRLQDFAHAYSQMHRWSPIRSGGEVLQVGPDNYPFPIPVARNRAGHWYFDTEAGKDEILARRIGKNELTAMDACQSIADAEQKYFQEEKEYAQKFVSDPGEHNGLYWAAASGERASPLAGLGDFTQAVSASAATGRPVLFNGYDYRILTKAGTPQGVKDYIAHGRMTRGFAILAYPAEYRKSGITSFVIGEDGTLHQKDLGEKTVRVASALTAVDPGDWSVARTQTGTATRTQP